MTRFVKLLSMVALLSTLMLAAGTANAAEVTDLYKASVAVPDRSVDARDQAVREGLGQVLVRVSGHSDVVGQESIRSALQDASRYVVQFGYQSRETLSPEDGVMVKTVYLNVKYDEAAINQFLRREGLPIWSSSRPNIVLWAAVGGSGGRQLVGGQDQPALQQLLQQQAQRRGLPLILPKYDSEDLVLVRAGDIWGMFVDPISQASRRYDANVVVVAKVLMLPDSVQVSAALNINDQQQWWETSAATLDLAAAALVDQLGDRVGERYAVQASMEVGQQVVLDITDVAQLKDYARLGEYLDGVLAIRGWHLSLAEGSHQQYKITLESNLEALEQGLRLDRKLSPRPEPMVAPLGGTEVSETDAPVADASADMGGNPSELPSAPAVEAELPVLYYRWNP